MIETKFEGTSVVMCHYPLEEWNGWHKGAVHFHCHTHKSEFISARRRGNVTVEAHGYKPIRMGVAINILLQQEKAKFG